MWCLVGGSASAGRSSYCIDLRATQMRGADDPPEGDYEAVDPIPTIKLLGLVASGLFSSPRCVLYGKQSVRRKCSERSVAS